MKTKIAIPNSNGETLHATLEIPPNKKVNQYAIFAHCFTCSSQLSIVRTISNELTLYGFGVLRFDFTGLGMSEGEFADTNFTHNLQDLITVNNYLAEHYQAPTLLIGHSLGGVAVLVSAVKLNNIKAVATIGAPADALHVSHLLGNKEDIIKKGEAAISIGGRPFKIKKHFLEDLENHDTKTIIPKLRIPILILHSPQDTVVGIENAAKIYQLAHHPKSFISLDGADHLLSKKADSLYAARSIATWADRYLNFNEEQEKLLKPENAQVVAHLDLQDNFTTQISNGRNTLVADEPKNVSGDDLGLAPFELLQAALGACTNMTLKLYAERKKWDLKEVYTHMSFVRDNQDNEKIESITKKIELEGNLTDEQKERLIEIAAKCPVNKTLLAGVNIKTLNYK